MKVYDFKNFFCRGFKSPLTVDFNWTVSAYPNFVFVLCIEDKKTETIFRRYVSIIIFVKINFSWEKKLEIGHKSVLLFFFGL